MPETKPRVAVLFDCPSDHHLLQDTLQRIPFACEMFFVGNYNQLRAAVCTVAAAATGSNRYAIVLNLCCAKEEDACQAECGVGAAAAAALLSHIDVPYTGCRAATLEYSLDVLFMMTVYAGMPMPAFSIVNSAMDAASGAAALKPPLQVRSTSPLLGLHSGIIKSGAEASEARSQIETMLATHGRLVVWEVPEAPASAEVVEMLVVGSTGLAALSIPELRAEGQWADWGKAFAKHVLNGCGLARVSFMAASDSPSGWKLVDVSLETSVSDLVRLCGSSESATQTIIGMLTEAQNAHPDPCFGVRLRGDDSRLGFHLCALRNVAKGELVFADECRSFAVVTRPHVEKHWDADMRKMFTEYAWPLDTEGHTYAIWEKDPRRWRPINHSCDPNCVFAAPHSLNVIAARDIAKGEDITMDYATFCDGTMKPFECLCGTKCCRGLIKPDAASLAKYGDNAWLRSVPGFRKSLI